MKNGAGQELNAVADVVRHADSSQRRSYTIVREAKVEPSAQIPSGVTKFQAFQMVSDNQWGWRQGPCFTSVT